MSAVATVGEPVMNGDADVKDVLDRLSTSDVLRALPPEEISALLPHVFSVPIAKGQVIFSKGGPGDAMYLVDAGSVVVTAADGSTLAGGPGTPLGEAALLHGDVRSDTAVAEDDAILWRIARSDYESVVHTSDALHAAHDQAVQKHLAGEKLAHQDDDHRRAWVGIALRAREAKHRGIKPWHWILVVGMALWVILRLNDSAGWVQSQMVIAAVQLIAGLLLIDAASEALILATDRTGARLNWDGFTSGTIGSLVETFPEFVVITFLVFVDPLAAFVTAAVTLFNNGLAFSIYSFFLPKDKKGRFLMPESLAKAGNEVLIAGSGIALLIGLVMIGGKAEGAKTFFNGVDLIVLAIVFIAIYAYYQYASIKYYAEGYGADNANQAPDPGRLGHNTSWGAIGLALLIGLGASYFGGDAIGGFADTAINHLHWPTIPTAAALAFFAGFSEFVVVYQAHKRGEIGIALSNTFGGITQVQTLLLALALGVMGVCAIVTGNSIYTLQINVQTTMLIVLQFPMLYVLTNFIEEDHTLNNLDAASMTGVYLLLLYFLFSF